MKILIVKLSSLGDIIQSLDVVDDLHRHFSDIQIDWVVEQHLSEILHNHPKIHQVIEIPLHLIKKKIRFSSWKKFLASISKLREEKYDVVFDLQGNTKSALFTMLSRSKEKVGYSYRSAREWPNLLVTKKRYTCNEDSNIRLKHLSLINQFFGKNVKDSFILKKQRASSELKDVMVCPGSKWANKQLSQETLGKFLQLIEEKWNPNFVFIWGTSSERTYCDGLKAYVKNGIVFENRLSMEGLQKKMESMDCVIAVDSSMLHLCGTTQTRSFSVFGPTKAEIFKPLGSHHQAFQGPCPYGRSFIKQCPVLRECETGACMKKIKSEELFEAFQKGIDVAKPGLPVDAV